MNATMLASGTAFPTREASQLMTVRASERGLQLRRPCCCALAATPHHAADARI